MDFGVASKGHGLFNVRKKRTGRRARKMRRETARLVRSAKVLGRRSKVLLMLAADMVAIPLALWTALALRFGTIEHGVAAASLLYAAAVICTIPVFVRLGLYRAVIRFLGIHAATAIAVGVSFSAISLIVLDLLMLNRAVPVGVFAIYFVLALLYVGATRFGAREFLRMGGATAENVIIYGAGSAGAQLCSSLAASTQYRPVAFIDDSASLRRARVYGLRVHGPEDLLELRRQHGVQLIRLALPTATRRRRSEVIDNLSTQGFKVQTVPDIGEIVSGQARLEEVRDIDVHDLLGRDPVPPNPSLFSACIRGKSILVTGAGGSIGSELCRQIMELSPRRLVLLEVSELALYEIERELRSLNARYSNRIELVALLGNAHHKQRVREIITTFGIQTVYHAAAYKHVPIVEHNMIEGIHNNIFATYNTAEAAMECRVETFVLISTDKAVNPTTVMGCTKRVAELGLQGLQQRGQGTRFCMVRFGNVLESSGSVVPLFREQIRDGGPVTVTHPDVIRYFMTIPEAAQLVIQAGSMGSGGDVFVLDMGSPVRIADLAKRMIQLAGYTVRDEQYPDGDIEIRFTGLRPAEKLFEELLIGKNVTGTEHPRILRAMEHSLTWDQIKHVLDDLGQCSVRFDCERAREILLRAVAEYQPTDKVQDHVWLHGGSRVSGAFLADDEKIRELRPRPQA
jgi:FlaA1/EpsC-like NDP-sugar epimerase